MADYLISPKVLVINPTFQCTAHCRHCGTLSSPQVAGRLPLAEMLDAIEQAAAAGFRGVAFSGGEPTLVEDDLFAAARHAALSGLAVRVVSNAHWAKTPEDAGTWIHRFAESGVSELVVSTGEQHIRFVPLDHVMHAVRAAVEAGIAVWVMVELLLNRTVTRETVEAHETLRSVRKDYPHAPLTIYESPWTPLSADHIQTYPEGVAITHTTADATAGCPSVLEHLSLFPNGNLAACCGYGMRIIPELKVGNLRQTGVAAAACAAESDPLLLRIRHEGPFQLLARAAEQDPDIEWAGRYAHPCQACIRLYRDARVRNWLRGQSGAKVENL